MSADVQSLIVLAGIIAAVGIPIGLLAYFKPNCLGDKATKTAVDQWWEDHLDMVE